jgi:predicted transcriptional regulator
MQVNIPINLQAKLVRIAEKQGCAPESLVQEAIERLVEYDEWFIRQVEKGLAQVERGELLAGCGKSRVAQPLLAVCLC